jgi:aminomuconate-semialdehyde/2-hydroxymuconate-6-semialdehyde dehydrogenase
MIFIQNYIDGRLVAPSTGLYMPNTNPATAQVFSQIPQSDTTDVAHAVAAAQRAFAAWSSTSIAHRSYILDNIAQGILSNLDALAHAETIDNGKPISVSKTVDIPRAADNFAFFATAIKHFATEAHTNPDNINYTLRMPVGVVGCISPWNLPLYLFTWKIAPALAVGNTVVAKPSEITPYTAYLLSQICIDAGLPPGVLNIVHGTGADVGAAIVAHPHIPVISFTGGTTTGKHIAAVAAPMFKKMSLELGGKNATIVFDDCDFEKTVGETARAAFSNQGQICLCGSRILVQKNIYEKFKTALIAKVQALKIGDPLDASTQVGATVSAAHYHKVLDYIAQARALGGHILCGGGAAAPAACPDGFFIAPTLIENLPNACAINQEEIFGAVATLLPFGDESEAIAIANDTPYGLAASVFTQNIGTAQRVSHALKTGIVWVNCWMLRDLRTPFGGTKQSGVGREGGYEALRFFTEPKNICIKF